MATTSIWLLAGALAFSFSTTALHAQSQYASSPLTAKKLRYKIGAENPGKGRDGEIVEVGYDWSKPLPAGISIAYCNLFNEKYSEQTEKQRAEYAPYLKQSDTAQEYGEGQIDPRGLGWRRNLTEQFERRRKQGFEYVELDNPDAYSMADVLGAVELAASYGLKVIAKNPKLMEGDPLPLRRAPERVWDDRGEGSGRCPRWRRYARARAGPSCLCGSCFLTPIRVTPRAKPQPNRRPSTRNSTPA